MGKPPFQKGDRLGPYIIQGTFRVGGMGIIYLVEGGRFLVKAPFADGERYILDQFREEVSALKRLGHPGIVKIIEDGTENGIPWYAMEKIEGESLRSLLKRKGKLSACEALRIEYQLAQAMAHAHSLEKPLLHRDLKPENICFQGDRPVILDFGLAQSGRGSSCILPPHGTLLYMAPEQIQGHSDARTDVYALGVVLYEMLSGAPPFARPTTESSNAEIIEEIMNLNLPVPALIGVKESISAVCQKALQKRSELRYADATEMIGDIKFALREQLKLEAIQVEQNRNYPVAAALLREAVEYGLPISELEDFWKFRLGKSLKVIPVTPEELKIGQKAMTLQKHPHLVPVLEVVAANLPYLVVEAPTSESLARRIAQGCLLNFQECSQLCQAIRSALEAVKQVNLGLTLDLKRIFPGATIRIGGIYQAQPAFEEVPAKYLAELLLHGLCGEQKVSWEELPDIFRDLLRNALEERYAGDAIAFARDIQEAWEAQQKQLQEIKKWKARLVNAVEGPLVQRLAGLLKHDPREAVRAQAKQTLEEVFGAGPQDGDWESFAATLPPGLSITQKIGKLLGKIFPGETESNGIQVPQDGFAGEEAPPSEEFVRFSRVENPEQLSAEESRELFDRFVNRKQQEATRRITQRIEKERSDLMRALVQKEEIAQNLQREVEQLRQKAGEQEKTIREQERFIQELKKKREDWLRRTKTTTLENTLHAPPIFEASLWDEIRTKESCREATVKIAGIIAREFAEEHARDILENLVRLAPDHGRSRAALADLYWKHEDLRELIDLYDGELHRSPEPRRKAWLYAALARIYRQVGEIDKALECCHAFLESVPGDLPTIKILEDVYEERQDWPMLIASCRKECDAQESNPDRRIALFLYMGELQEEKIQNYEAAQENYRAAISLAPDNLIAILGLERIHAIQEQYDALEKVLLAEADIQKDRERVIEVYLEIAQIREERLGDHDGAIEYFQKVHLVRPLDLAVIRRLKSLYSRKENWIEYCALAEKELALVPTSKAALDLNRELMRIYHEKLHHLEKAVSHGKKAHETDPDHLETLVYLEEIYSASADKASLAQAYLKEAKLVADKDRLVLIYTEAGKIYRELGETTLAIECLRKTIKIRTSHGEALSLLIELLPKVRRWEELIDVYQVAIRMSVDHGEQRDFHLKIARLWEKEFENFGNALLHNQVAYQLDPQDLTAVQNMKRLLRRQGRFGEAISMMEAEARLSEEAKRPALYFEIGVLWEEKLKSAGEAIASYRRVLGFGFHRASAERTMRLQRETGDFEGLACVLKEDVRHTPPGSPQLPEKLERLAEIYRVELGQPAEALRVYMALLKLGGNPEPAVNAMAEILEVLRDWKSLPIVLKQKLPKAVEERELFDLHIKIAAIYDERLHEGEKAIVHYEKALELYPDDIATLHHLQKLYEKWGYFGKLAALYETELGFSPGQERTREIYRRLGETWHTRLFDSRKAVESLQKLWELAPDEEVARALASLCECCALWEKLAEILKWQLDRARQIKDKERQVEMGFKLGQIHYQKLRLPAPAARYFSEALELTPAHEEVFQALSLLYQEEDNAAELAHLLEKKERLVKDPGRLVKIRLQLGHLHCRLENTEKAIRFFQNVLVVEPERLEALQNLRALYQSREDWKSLAQVAQKELNLTMGSRDKADLCALLGNYYRQHEKSAEKARGYFAQAVEVLPSHVPSLVNLSEIFLENGNWEEAARYMAEAVGHMEATPEKAAILTSLGDLYFTRMSQPERARVMYESALAIVPDTLSALEPLSEIYFVEGRWADLEFIMARLVTQTPKTEEAKLAGWYRRWGQVAEALQDTEEATGHYLSALDLVPKHKDALLALGNIYWSDSAWAKAVEIYQRLYDLQSKEEEASGEFLRRLAIAEEKLGHFPKSIEHYQKLLELPGGKAEIYKELAALYRKVEDYQQSIAYLDRLLKEKVDNDEKHRTLIQKARLLVDLKDRGKAIDCYIQALRFIPEDTESMRALVELCMAGEEWKRAREYNEERYRHLEEISARVENRSLMGQILWDGFHNLSLAVESYQQALALDPTCAAAMDKIAEICGGEREWTLLAQAYRKFLHGLPPQQPDMEFPARIALGHLLHAKLNDTPAAVEEFTRALAIRPDHAATEIALAELKAQLPDAKEEAVAGHLTLLRHDPFRLSSYHLLHQLLKGSDRVDLARSIHRAIEVLDPTHAPAASDLASGPAKPQKISRQTALHYLIPAHLVGLWEAMAFTSVFQHKNYSCSLDRKYGVNKKEHPLSSSYPDVWESIRKIAAIFDIDAIEAYLVPQDLPTEGFQIFVENTCPPTLLIGKSTIEALPADELQWLAAKYLFWVAHGQVLSLRLNDGELQEYVAALRGAFASTHDTQSVSKAQRSLHKKILAAIPRKVVAMLKERRDLGEIDGTRLDQYRKCLEYTSNHAALLLTDALDLSLKMTSRLWQARERRGVTKELSPAELSRSEEVRSLLVFNISPAAEKFRLISGKR